MKGDLLLHHEQQRIGTIERIRLAKRKKNSTIIFYDGTRCYVDLSDYSYDKEKKLWKFT